MILFGCVATGAIENWRNPAWTLRRDTFGASDVLAAAASRVGAPSASRGSQEELNWPTPCALGAALLAIRRSDRAGRTG
jgi:hypothetical protein